MATIREITDGGSSPIESLRKSQADGSVGNGTQETDAIGQRDTFNQSPNINNTADDTPTPSKGASLPFLP